MCLEALRGEPCVTPQPYVSFPIGPAPGWRCRPLEPWNRAIGTYGVPVGFFSRLFGAKKPAEPARATWVGRDGVSVIQATDTFKISGRGVVVTGRMLTTAVVDEWFDVDYQGKPERLRLSKISINEQAITSVEPGATVALLLVNASSAWTEVISI